MRATHCFRLIVAGAIVLATSACRRSVPPTAAQADRILDALVFFEAPIAADSTMDPAIRAAANAYDRRRAAYVPRTRPAGESPEFAMARRAWERYERGLVAVTDDPRAPALAQGFVDSLRPAYEWEGLAEPPMRDARFSDAYRAAHPDSPFAELLALLAAHRWLCAAEALRREQENAAAGDRDGKATDLGATGLVASDARASDANAERALATALTSRDVLVRVAAERLSARRSCLPASHPG